MRFKIHTLISLPLKTAFVASSFPILTVALRIQVVNWHGGEEEKLLVVGFLGDYETVFAAKR